MLGIVTVQWNSSQHTLRLIESLAPCLGENLSLVIVDNGSDRAHLAALKDSLSRHYTDTSNPDSARITLIENERNSGFARGNNIGIEHCLAQKKLWVWLLNNDTTISAEDMPALLQKLGSASPGLYGTRIREPGKPDICAGYVFNRWTSQYRAITGDCDALLNTPMAYISGASMLIHHEVFEQSGLLDDSTFLYFEELDFCIRSRQRGFRLALLDGVMVNHLAGGSARDPSLQQLKTYHETWSTLYFYAKHQKMMLPLMLVARTAVKILMLLVKSRRNEIHSVLSATGDFMNGYNRDAATVNITGMHHYK